MNTNVEELLIYKIVILWVVLSTNEIKIYQIERGNQMQIAKLKAPVKEIIYYRSFYPQVVLPFTLNFAPIAK